MNEVHQQAKSSGSSKGSHESAYSVLVVDGSPGHSQMVRMMLSSVGYPKFNVETVGRLSEAIAACAKNNFDGCILDLDLPDSKGIDTLMQLHQTENDLAIVVLASPLEESLGALLIKYGAQDEIAQDGMTAEDLARTITYAIERNRSVNKGKRAAHNQLEDIDELKQALQQSRETFTSFFRSVLGLLANRAQPMPPSRNDTPHLSMPMIMINEECTVQEVNDFACELFGMTEEQCLGKKINEVLQFGKERQLLDFLKARRAITFSIHSVAACHLGSERKFVSTHVSPFGNGCILLFIDQTPHVVTLNKIRGELMGLMPE